MSRAATSNAFGRPRGAASGQVDALCALMPKSAVAVLSTIRDCYGLEAEILCTQPTNFRVDMSKVFGAQITSDQGHTDVSPRVLLFAGQLQTDSWTDRHSVNCNTDGAGS